MHAGNANTETPTAPKTYDEYSDAQLVCAFRHGWTAKSYLGHGISDRAYHSRVRLVAEMDARGISRDGLEVRWGTCDCDVPRYPATGHPLTGH